MEYFIQTDLKAIKLIELNNSTPSSLLYVPFYPRSDTLYKERSGYDLTFLEKKNDQDLNLWETRLYQYV